MTQATGRETDEPTAQRFYADSNMTEDEMMITERAAELGWEFAEGAQYTTAQVEERYNLSPSGAWRLLTRISRRISIYRHDGTWQRVPKKN